MGRGGVGGGGRGGSGGGGGGGVCGGVILSNNLLPISSEGLFSNERTCSKRDLFPE